MLKPLVKTTVPMTLQDKLENGQFVLTTEVGPPKGASLEKILRDLLPLQGRVDAVNVTDLQSSVMRMGALAACVILKNHGFEMVYQMSCRDRNRLALQSDLLSAAALGITNILALTGDHPVLGDHPQAKPVFDLDSVQLLTVIKGLAQGVDMNGHLLIGPPPVFFAGGVVNPSADPLEPEIIKMEKKIQAGARFFQTQAVFDVGVFENFLKAAERLKTRIIAGVLFLKSERMARYMNDHVPGMRVPVSLMDELSRAQDPRAVTIDIALRLMNQIRDKVQGIHLMPIGWNALVPNVLERFGR